MADTMQFDLVSPERKLVSVAARAVRIPGAEGDMTAMPGHAPTLTTLRPGFVTVDTAGGEEHRFVVTGGFAEIGAEGVSVLAERGMKGAEFTQEIYTSLVTEARGRLDAAPQEHMDMIAKLVADLQALATESGLRPD